MISKKYLIARNPNPYSLTPEQLADLEITKAQVAKHLATIDFSKHNEVATSSNQDVEHRAERFIIFRKLINPKSRGK
jgi:hypothetical protein